ncbi:integral membrane protein [Colletotrichum cereale]|nr:integral membrane protein [Colletotrichum cereale]
MPGPADTHFGDGLHQETLSRGRFFLTQEISIVAIAFYQAAFTAIKTTFLLQYRRAFLLPAFQKLCNIFIALIIAFGISQVVSVSLACIPLRSLWDATVPGRCIALLDWWYIGSSISLATDVAIFVMPLPLLRTVQLPLRQKVVLIATFGLGFFTCAISVVRLATLKNYFTLGDATYNTVIAGVWSITELSCAIICVCVPTLHPLLDRQHSRTRPPSWLRPKFDESDNNELLDQSDRGGALGQQRKSRVRSGLQQIVSQADLQPARNSSLHPRSRLHIDLSNVPGLSFPPAVHLTPCEDSALQSSPWRDTMVPFTRFDTEEGVGFLNSDMPEPEQPTPLKPPPRRHTGIAPSSEDDGFFGAVVWDASSQPRLPGSSGPT